MKKIISLNLLFLTIIFKINAQVITPNITNNSLGKFEGEWLWATSTDTVRLHLKKIIWTTDPVNNYTIEIIAGYHQYKIGTHIIESSYEFKNTTAADNKFTLTGRNNNGNDTLTGHIKDIFRNKTIAIDLILNAGHTSLIWHTGYVKGMTVNETSGYTLPKDMVLIKQ